MSTCRRDGERITQQCNFTGTSVWRVPCFARVALLQKYTSSNNHLLPRWSENVISDYNSDFRGYSRMLLPTDPKNVSKRVMNIRECFGRRWNPADTKAELDAWNSLPLQSKQQHSLQLCTACDCNYSLHMVHFPIRSKGNQAKERSLESSRRPSEEN